MGLTLCLVCCLSWTFRYLPGSPYSVAFNSVGALIQAPSPSCPIFDLDRFAVNNRL